jgi:hypothetical protein
VPCAVESGTNQLTHSGIEDDLSLAVAYRRTRECERTINNFRALANMEDAGDEVRSSRNECSAWFDCAHWWNGAGSGAPGGICRCAECARLRCRIVTTV